MIGKLEEQDYDRWLEQADQAESDSVIAANDAFVAALAAAAKRGREKVTAGTTVDSSAPVGAKRLRGILPMSYGGSPAAMCLEARGR